MNTPVHKRCLTKNSFDIKLNEIGEYPLKAKRIDTLQVNMGYKCNLRCSHCHVGASPDRKEMMPLTTIAHVLSILRENSEIITVDVTGGSPELNPYFGFFVKTCVHLGKKMLVRSNLAVYTEEGKQNVPQFLADHHVKIVASLPCYSEAGVESQRGKGTYWKAVSVLKHLNELGYGRVGTGLELDIMFNPAGASAAPEQQSLEKAYKSSLFQAHGIVFNRLIALSNMPIGRLGEMMTEERKQTYLKALEEQFNPHTVEHLMCRHLISVSPEGKLYDCDFWQMLNLPIQNDIARVADFDYEELQYREIVTNPLCFLCTAGAGASCRGALV